jgi:hypothetical protein
MVLPHSILVSLGSVARSAVLVRVVLCTPHNVVLYVR